MRFLTTSGVAADLEHLTRDAAEQLVLVTPYLKLSPNFADRLADADARGVAITLLYGKNELTSTQRTTLGTLDHLTLYYYQHLHAKCYYNEHRLILSSMNLYEYSEKTNREMGVLVEAGTDVYRDAVAETESIIRAATEKPILYRRKTVSKAPPKPIEAVTELKEEPRVLSAMNVFGKLFGWVDKAKQQETKSQEADSTRSKPQKGHCLRCATDIPFRASAPYCRSCYSRWSYFQNWSFEDKHCHRCGEQHPATMEKPFCHPCFREHKASK